uniref:protein cramped-like n=1 Tax=Myxine glutinosa TaxID=7769 RepID=UPI00358F6C10
MTVQAEDGIDGTPKKSSKKVPTDSCNSNGETFAAALRPEPLLPASSPNRAGPLPVDAQRLLRSSVRPPVKRARSDSSSTLGKGRAEAVAGSVDAAVVTAGCGTNTNAGAARKEQGSVGTLASDSTEVEKAEGPQKKVRRQWESWSTVDNNSFFEGLNEHGKDFEAIQNSFAQRYRKKGRPANMVKNKEQVRHFYYRTWHKICKYIDFDNVFSQDLKKSSQELYGLICYGELRKKIGGCMDDKKASKLNELIQIGATTVRYKGRNLRIKMPMCRSLKKICDPYGASDDEDQKPSKLPPKVCLELLPKTNKAWAHVQNTAHNPRLRMIVELHRKVASLIAFLREKWSPRAARLRSNLSEGLQRTSLDVQPPTLDVQHSELRLYPPKEAGVTLLAGVARIVHTKALCTVHWHQEGRARHAPHREGHHVAKMTSCKDSGGVGSPVSVAKVLKPPRPPPVAEGQVDSVSPDGDSTVSSPPEEICSVPLKTSTNFCSTPPWPSGVPSTSANSPLPVPPRWDADDNSVSDTAMRSLQSGRNVSNPVDSDDCEGLPSEGTVMSPGEQWPKINDYSNCGPKTYLEVQGETWTNECETQNTRVIAGLAECAHNQEVGAKKVLGDCGVGVSEDVVETGSGTGFPPKKSKEEAAIEFANNLREEGWGATMGPLTIAEVYLMLGKPSKLQLDYDWPELGGLSMTRVNGQCSETVSSTPLSPLDPTGTAEAWDPTLRTGLKQLLQLAILQANVATTQDPSGLTLLSKQGAEGSAHGGSQRSPGSARGAGGRAARNLTVSSSGPKPHARLGGLAASGTITPTTPEAAGLTVPATGEATRQSLASDGEQRDNGVVFRIPAPPLSAPLQLIGSSCENCDAEMAFRQQLDSINKQPEMYLPQQRKMRNRPLRKPLVVQRTLLPRPTGQPTRHMYELSIIPNSSAAGKHRRISHTLFWVKSDQISHKVLVCGACGVTEGHPMRLKFK